MSKTYNKQQKSTVIAKEDRYPRGIALAIIAFLTLFMPVTLAKRLVSILLIAVADLSNKKVAIMVDTHVKTVKNLRCAMQDHEVHELMVIKKGSGRKSKVSSDVRTQIAEKVNKGAFYCLRQIARMAESCFKVKMSLSSISRILKSFKIRKLKCGSYPAKADVKKQREFYENTLHPLMEKANNEEVNLFHVDASHFIMGDDHKGGIYGVFRRFKLTFSGRSRYNVLGALNHTSKKVHTITNDTDSKDKYITSKQVCRLLVRLSKEYVATKKPIVLILDNAKYQRCSLVQKVAQRLRIQLVFIPPYSPNLNLIERLWKFTKGELCTATYSNFQEFKEAIDEIIESTVGKNKQRIDSLIGEKVQLFDEVVTVQEPKENDKAA